MFIHGVDVAYEKTHNTVGISKIKCIFYGNDDYTENICNYKQALSLNYQEIFPYTNFRDGEIYCIRGLNPHWMLEDGTIINHPYKMKRIEV